MSAASPCGEHFLPVLFHVDNNPSWLLEGLVQLADVALTVVGILALRIGVMHQQPQSAAFAGHGVLDHLHVAVGIAECQNRAPADVLIDTDRLAGLVVDKVDFRLADDRWFAILNLEFGYGAGADDPFRRNAVIFFGDGTHELDTTPGDDEVFESVGPQVGEQFKLGLIDTLAVEAFELGCLAVASQLEASRSNSSAVMPE